MNKYLLAFAKNGYIKYTSHLDMQRLFKRLFRRTGIPLSYSAGFNPHPKMSFAQPLSLGYTAKEELLEFRTEMPLDRQAALRDLSFAVPQGLDILFLESVPDEMKSLASAVKAASYRIFLPCSYQENRDKLEEAVLAYKALPSIRAEKYDKKTKMAREIEIRDKIQDLSLTDAHGKASLLALLDTGSQSNLSPELLITSFLFHSGLPFQRIDMEVCRDYLIFDACIPHSLGLHLEQG